MNLTLALALTLQASTAATAAVTCVRRDAALCADCPAPLLVSCTGGQGLQRVSGFVPRDTGLASVRIALQFNGKDKRELTLVDPKHPLDDYLDFDFSEESEDECVGACQEVRKLILKHEKMDEYTAVTTRLESFAPKGDLELRRDASARPETKAVVKADGTIEPASEADDSLWANMYVKAPVLVQHGGCSVCVSQAETALNVTEPVACRGNSDGSCPEFKECRAKSRFISGAKIRRPDFDRPKMGSISRESGDRWTFNADLIVTKVPGCKPLCVGSALGSTAAGAFVSDALACVADGAEGDTCIAAKCHDSRQTKRVYNPRIRAAGPVSTGPGDGKTGAGTARGARGE